MSDTEPRPRLVDLTLPAASALPVPAVPSEADVARWEDDLAVDRRGERRLLLWELVAVLVVVVIVVVRQLWLL